MATIKKQGKGYKITVSNGYDINGKQLREHMTWVPDPGMTDRQIEKELNRQATLFEEQVRCSITHNGNIRLKDFTELFLKEYAKPNLKAKTAFNYEEKMKTVNQALGHIKLKELKPGHIASFYANLQDEGVRAKELAVINVDFTQWLKEHNTTATAFSNKANVSLWTIKKLKNELPIAKNSAIKIAKAMEVNPQELFNFQKDMRPLSASTIQTYHRNLSAVLSCAVKWGYIQTNPVSRVSPPSNAYHSAAYLDEPDARRLLELLQNEPIKWRTLVTFDLFSGLRRGELAGLRWCDVDFDNRTITVKQTSNYLPKKGIYIDTPKSPKSVRYLHLSPAAFLMLLEYKDWQDSQKEKLGDAWKDEDERIFTTDSGSPIFPDSISQWFTKFIKRTDLPKVTLHSLRHTNASLMIADGIPLIVVSKNLGHAQASTTSNIYAHVIASVEAKATQTFDKFNDIVAPELDAKPEKDQKHQEIIDIQKIG